MIPGSFLIALILNKLHRKFKSTEKQAGKISFDSPFNNVRIVDESVFQEARERSSTFKKSGNFLELFEIRKTRFASS